MTRPRQKHPTRATARGPLTSVALTFLSAALVFAADRQVAITIDDLPRGGDGGPTSFEGIRAMTVQLLKPFHDEKIPLIGFVNSGRTSVSPTELRKILDLWLDAGADLGNHTSTHPSLNTTPVDQYEADILKGEAILREAVEAHKKKLEFFRYPFLQVGPTAESKRAVADFLTAHRYRNAPVTFDDSDYMFARAYTDPTHRERVKREYLPYLESVIAFFEQRSVEVVGHELPQILLIHASQLNADSMMQMLAMFRRRGYSFVSLDTALRDPAYQRPENYVGRGGFSWIHRWSMTAGMKFDHAEPDEPEWVRTYFQHPNEPRP
jgi:peptidoglycan/xylan/chitin deacetylase (PgdA/CDA1 family)